DILAGVFSPEDGYTTPEAVVAGYAHGARGYGAGLRPGCEGRGVNRPGGGVTGVVAGPGTNATGTVVCAARGWSRKVAGMVGVDLPVTPLRRQILFTEPILGLPPGLPMTIDFETSFYFHREGPGLLMGMSPRDEQPGFNLETSQEWLPDLFDVV